MSQSISDRELNRILSGNIDARYQTAFRVALVDYLKEVSKPVTDSADMDMAIICTMAYMSAKCRCYTIAEAIKKARAGMTDSYLAQVVSEYANSKKLLV